MRYHTPFLLFTVVAPHGDNPYKHCFKPLN